MKNISDELRKALGNLSKTLDILKEANKKLKAGMQKSSENNIRLNKINDGSENNNIVKIKETWVIDSNNSTN